jgi:adenylate cyclase
VKFSFFRKGKKSFLVLFIVGFWLAYSAFSISFFVSDLQGIFQKDGERRAQQIQYHCDIAMSFLARNQIDALKDSLQEAMKLDQFDFAILMNNDPKQNQPPFVITRTGHVNLASHYQPTQGVQKFGPYLYETIQVGSLTLTLGAYHEKALFIQTYLKNYALKIIFDIGFMTLMSGVLIYLILKDVIQLSRILRFSPSREVSHIRPQSLEAQSLLSATEGLEARTAKLSTDSQQFSASLGPAITAELRRGTSTPFAFDAILARMDLNSYTQKFLSHELKHMTALLNNYFRLAREIIERYQGLIYQHIGDEIIFFFKYGDEFQLNQQDAMSKAVCCLRDIFIELETFALPDFHVKASLSVGTLHFIQLDQGYAFSGLPLIQSVRMLGFVQEKKKNSLLLTNSDYLLAKNWIIDFEKTTAFFKGFQEETELVEAKSFTPMSKADPLHYRSTRDLEASLRLLQEHLAHQRFEEARTLIHAFQNLQIGSRAEIILSRYLMILDLALSMSTDPKLLSALASLSTNLVARESYNDEVRQRLMKIEQSSDPRTQANALLARSFFEHDIYVDLKEMSASNRLFADSLLVLGRQRIDKEIFQQILFLVKHQDLLFQSSGFYVIADLLLFYEEKDPVYFKTNPYFGEMLDLLKESLQHPQTNIHKHALNYQKATGRQL